MNRINITNNARWFDADRAEKFTGATYHNGRNFIQKQTNDQWTGQNLYLTASGTWVLACWSSWQGSVDTYHVVEKTFAAKWLIKNEDWEEVEKRFPETLKEMEV